MVSWDPRKLSSSGYWSFSHPEIRSGDQSRIRLLATMSRNLSWRASRQLFGRKAESQAWSSASWARLDPVVGPSHEATNRKRFLGSGPRAPLAVALAANGDQRQEQCRRGATTQSECN